MQYETVVGLYIDIDCKQLAKPQHKCFSYSLFTYILHLQVTYHMRGRVICHMYVSSPADIHDIPFKQTSNNKTPSCSWYWACHILRFQKNPQSITW